MSFVRKLLVIVGLSVALTGCGMFGDAEPVIKPDPVVFEATKALKTQWSVSLGADLGYRYHQFSPAITDQYVIALTAKGSVAAVDKDNGNVAWRFDANEPLISGVGAGSGYVAIVTRSAELIVLDNDGQEVWRVALDGEVLSVPQIRANILAIQQVNGVVRAFDVKTASPLWRFDSTMPTLTFRGTASPKLTSEYTFAALDNGKLIALKNTSGDVVFERALVQPNGRTDLERVTDIDGQPVIDQRVLYLASYANKVLALDLTDGTVLWERSLSSYQPVGVGLSRVVVVSDDGIVNALDQLSGADVWAQSALKYRFLSAPYLWGEHIALTDSEGHIFVLSQIDGELAAMSKSSVKGQAATLVGDDTMLYSLSHNGKLSALSLIDVK